MNASPRPAVVSLVPSITESLRAWGRDPIACTKYCEQPDLPTVGGTKNPDIDAIAALNPDVVMLDREENRKEDAEALEARGIEILVTDVRLLSDVNPELAKIAACVGAEWSGSPSVQPLPAEARRRRVFIPIWRRPWMTIGAETYGSTVLAALGYDNIFALPDDGTYPEVTLDTVAERRPDLVLAPTEPYVFERSHLAELSPIAPVVEIDGQDLFWWGTRTAAAVDRLRNVLDNVLDELDT